MAKWGMPESLAKSLEQVLAYEYVNLRVLTNEQAAVSPAGAESWSRKEELGHLIDSAVNNHVRFAAPRCKPNSADQATSRTVGCAPTAITKCLGRRCSKGGGSTTNC